MNNKERQLFLDIASGHFDSVHTPLSFLEREKCDPDAGIDSLIQEGWLNPDGRISIEGQELLERSRPRNAVILAAGFGMRMVPINRIQPKGLIEVRGEILIERLIRQLHEAGITQIHIVVGFMKEKFEYLEDQFGVRLITNTDYAQTNNLVSLSKAAHLLGNTYILPCDVWFKTNPFSAVELSSWYMFGCRKNPGDPSYVDQNGNILHSDPFHPGNNRLGLAFLTRQDSRKFIPALLKAAESPEKHLGYWEDILDDNHWQSFYGKVMDEEEAIGINTYEQLREIDEDSRHLQSIEMSIIAQTLDVSEKEIHDIEVLKKGMTNRSFLFSVNDERFIMRVPGEGTDKLINRSQEADVYRSLAGKGICDDVLYMNPDNGIKITRYLENTRNCNPLDWEEVGQCMKMLRSFHDLGLQVDHKFDVFERIEFYDSLIKSNSAYRDYEKVKNRVFQLKPFIEQFGEPSVLCHIDSVCDNFLLQKNGDIRLIDWEYAGMADRHLDLAMNCIYAMYDKPDIDHLIRLYFDGEPTDDVRMKIYAYIAAAGLLWSNWCEYKASLGQEFGEYSLAQYRYAKKFSRIVLDYMRENRKNEDKTRYIKQAVIMAAGKGERLRPVTEIIPKPLITVNGIAMIENIIQNLKANKISDIYIVVGYLKESFKYLEKRYEGITLIENPYYNTCNNISSLYVAREHLEDTIILDGDQLIFNPEILHRDFQNSGYAACEIHEESSEWILNVKDNKILDCSRNGGDSGYRLYSLSRWSCADGKKLKALLEEEFENQGRKQIYWDDIPVFLHPEDFDLSIDEIRSSDIVEIDSLSELAAMDPSYEHFLKTEEEK